MNVVVLRGKLSSEPRSQELSSGSVLTRWEVTTPSSEGRLTVPVTWFDPPRSVRGLDADDEVVVVGTVRRRFYTAGGRTVSATDVVAEAGCRASHRTRVARMLAEAVDRLEVGSAAA